MRHPIGSLVSLPEILVWLALLIAVLVVVLGCGGSALLECRVNAVAGLPLEADQITLGDLKGVVAKVKACQAGDAGVR